MARTIALSDVGRLLGTRMLGETVRSRIEAVRASTPNEDLIIDFTGVEVITASFADEAFGKLTRRPESTATLMFRNYNQTVAAVLTYVLRRVRLHAAP